MFYLENGLVKFNYTGTYIQDGIKYNIVNGVVKGKENVLTVMRMPNSVLTNSIKMVIWYIMLWLSYKHKKYPYV
mgnify:FL=1